MYGVRLWLVAATLQALLLAANCISHHRRSMVPTPATFPVSRSGWRPVISSGGLLYSFNTAPLHQSGYRIPVPVIDPGLDYTSARPLPTRETTKLSSVPQTYKTTTIRTLPSTVPNQPINSYLNPFALPNSAIAHFKYVGNYPVELLRNPYNPFIRQVYTKYPNKYKQPIQNLQQYQQLTNVQPIQFGQYQVPKPVDVFAKPVENFVKQDAKKQQNTLMEIFKPEVYQVPVIDTTQKAVTQQVKTAQQQQSLLGNVVPAFNAYPHFSFQDALHPPNVLGTFGSFGVQSTKGREPPHPTTKTTYLPPQPTKQTIFNSFSYNPTYKSTPTQFTTTTPRYSTTSNFNHLAFGSKYRDSKLRPTPYSKTTFPSKIDPNAGAKTGFKPSPYDPFIKHYQNDYNKVTTYKPVHQTTTLASTLFEYSFPLKTQLQNYYNQDSNSKYESKKVIDNIAAGVNQQTKQYTSAPQNSEFDGTLNTPYQATYEVTESTESDHISHSSQDPWTPSPQVYDFSDHRTTPEPTKIQEFVEPILTKPTTTPLPALEEEYTIVTEAERGYEDSLNYDKNVESQSRRPLGDDFEPIEKYKLKDYYYKVSTPSYDNYNTRRTKKPTEATRITIFETTTETIRQPNDVPIEALPTLPPNQHFKRPNSPDAVDKDKIRKRNKSRRRRPIQGNPNYTRAETTTRATTTQVTRESFKTDPIQTTESEEVYTIRPRPRPTKITYETNPTTPSITTDLSTSAIPTVTPTRPTIVKKLAARRPITTTTDRAETTTLYKEDETSNDSSIMKIGSRLQLPKTTVTVYEFRTSQPPDYTHKQDEKDTPTSDVTVSLTDTFNTNLESVQEFSFHKDVKPIEAITYHPYTEPTTEYFKTTNLGTEITTLSPETTSNTERSLRPRLRNKYNRPKFSVKDYRSRMSSTTSTTEKSIENIPRVRFPQRRLPFIENGNDETTTERKRFTPKDPRHRLNGTELNEETEKEIHSFRQSTRQRQTDNEGTALRISSRIRQSQRRRPTEETTENPSTTTVHSKRPLRRKVVQDSETGESVQDLSVTENLEKSDISSEKSHSESAIMKIADKKQQQDHIEHLFEHSKRVSDLTLAASKDYNKPGMFKTASSNSRRIPNYFTIATDDPILPIEAFFPQLNQKKES
ncbi:hypothetical protein K1T71_010113 [Dendrolimus kikuchii]|uniref:Uncharacterized protein n=1 Tax=Dendrolimus kikuchii TaxID=765133 RepID=A0ACC1CRU9_9NEOP|nr:hypothetical protein K1T71_010113 [Dendrolimus kikuchii]